MKKDLCLNKRGKVVSKKSLAAGKRNFKRLQGWLKATQQARKQLGLTGFVACKREPSTIRSPSKFTESKRFKLKLIA